jgi:predicted DNA-binding protein
MARVPEELVERIKRYAAQKRQPISVIIRDALEILLEEDRYQPFMSDRKAGDENLSDIKVDRLHMMSDMNEGDDITSDANRDEVAQPGTRPVITSDIKEESHILSDTKEALSGNLSDMKAVDDIVSDIKEADTESKPESTIMSDINAPDFDATKHVLGKLCPRGHDYQGTGQSLLRRANLGCLECDKEKARERRRAKRS